MGCLLCASYIGGDSMGVILGWIAFGLAALRLVSIVVHAIYSATAKGGTLADSGNDKTLLE